MAVERKYIDLFLDEAEELLAKLGDRILTLEKDPTHADALKSALRLAHTLKGSSRMVGLGEVSGLAHGLEGELKEVSEAGGGITPEGVSSLLAAADRIHRQLGKSAQGASGGVPPSTAPLVVDPSPSPPAGTPTDEAGLRLRVDVAKLDALQNLGDDLVLQNMRVLDRIRRLQRVVRGLERVVWDEEDRPLTAPERAQVRTAIRMLTGRGFGQFLEEFHRLDQIASEVQHEVLDLRMVPVDELFQRFHRTVRDLARELGKQVDLVFDGQMTEIDKRLLDEIRAPLDHLVRNAVDHGIETPAEREAVGKPPAGTLVIRAYHRGSAVVVEVEDDGRGLDPDDIRKKALDRGVRDPAVITAMPPEEVLYLLCDSGFSTRDRVTEWSGRGVGLDAVKVRVERLKGSLSLGGTPGRGARFSLFLPLSVSTLSVLFVEAGGALLALPSHFVERCFVTSAAGLDGGDGTWAYEGRVVPVVSLARALDLGGDVVTKRVGLVALRFRNRAMVVQVDRLLEEREVVLKPLGQHLKSTPLVSGIAFRPDGQPVPVLNVVDLHARWTRMEATARFTGSPVRTPGRVLVVDDSITTRHLEQNVLESLGFEVRLATNGSEAWVLLQHEKVDLVVTDIEMPEMTGLELTRRIRGDDVLADLPVVAVSNKGGEDDQTAGFEAGVDAYIPKAGFRQRAFHATVRTLIRRGRRAQGEVRR